MRLNSILQGHPTHPSHHHTFCPFQTQIISLHCPGFSSIYQNTLDTSTIDPSFDIIRCTTHSQNRRKLLILNLAQVHLTLALAASITPPPEPIVCHPNSKIWTHTPPSHLALAQPHSATLPEQSHHPNISCSGNRQHTPIYLKYHYNLFLRETNVELARLVRGWVTAFMTDRGSSHSGAS